MKKLDKRIRTFWGIAEIGEGVMTSVNNMFFVLFLTDIANLPLAFVNAILMITSIMDFLLVPTCGAFISVIKPMKWGRLRSWLIVGIPFVILCNSLQYVSVPNSLITTVIIITAYIVMSFFFNAMVTANVSLIPNMTKGMLDSERSHLASNRMTGSNIGRLMAGYVAPNLLLILRAQFDGVISYFLLACCAGAFLGIGYFVHFKISKGYENESLNEQGESKTLSLKQIGASLIKNPPLFAVMVSDLTSNVGSFLLPALAGYYYTYVIQDFSLLSIHMLFTGIGGMFGAYFSRFVLKRIHGRKACLVIYPFIAVIILSSRFFAYDPVVFIGLNMIMQFLVGMTQPMESTLYMDTIVYNEWKTGVDATGFIMGMMNFPIKVAVIIKSAILSVTFVSIGYQAGAAPTPELQQGIINAYTIIPMIIPLIGWVALRFFYHLTEDKLEIMKKEIQERK